MNKQGCEIEAIGISYKIYTQCNENPLSLCKRGSDQLLQQAQGTDQHCHVASAPGGMRTVLNQVSCRAKPWEILAIVGPSGAGKSSLLEILAAKLTPQAGSIFINGNASELRSRVRSLMQELGLDHVAGTRVGNDEIRGISGGERRRVSIGVDVIHNPKVLILDEPTSGLDSTSALQIIDMLKNMAETRGRTIILSIHQPGFRIVKLFNSILLLANGTVLHHGTVDRLGSRLELLGLNLPPHCNVVEFAIDCLKSAAGSFP